MSTHTSDWIPNPSEELHAKQEQMRSSDEELNQTYLVNNVWDNSLSVMEIWKKKCFSILAQSFIYFSHHAFLHHYEINF